MQGPREDTAAALNIQTAAAMALTKSDLVELLSIFKTELRSELKMDLSAEFQTFRTEMNEKLAGLRADVDSVGARVLESEDLVQGLESRSIQHARELQELRDQMELTLLKTEDLENRSRRDNLRVRGLKEEVEGPDITATMLSFFGSLLPPGHPEIQVVRAHRVGPHRRDPRAPPRDILVKLLDSRVKDLILKSAREADGLKCGEYDCSVFQDLSSATLMRRNAFRPITAKLSAENIRYRWLFPFGIAFEFQNKPYQTSNLNKAAKILGITLEEDKAESSNAEPSAGGSAPWLNNRAGWRFQRGKTRRARRSPDKTGDL